MSYFVLLGIGFGLFIPAYISIALREKKFTNWFWLCNTTFFSATCFFMSIFEGDFTTTRYPSLLLFIMLGFFYLLVLGSNAHEMKQFLKRIRRATARG